MKRHATALALLALVACGGYSAGGGPRPLPAEAPVTPSVGSQYLDRGTGTVYIYADSIAGTAVSAYIAPPEWVKFGKNASSVTGALNFTNNVVCDTTTDAADGFFSAESLLVTAINMSCGAAVGAAPNCTTQIYTNAADASPVMQKTFVWTGGSNGDGDNAQVFYLPAATTSVYLLPKAAGAVNPAQPQVTLRVHRFVRP